MIPIPLTAWIVAFAGLYLVAFTVLATLFFLVGTGLLGTFAHPYWQWWLYALWYSDNPVVRTWLEVSGVPAALVPLVPAAIILYRRRLISGWTEWPAIPRTAWIVLGVALYLATFTMLATLFFLVGTGLLGAFAHPFWQWWLYALWYSNDPAVRAWLEVSGVPAAVLPLVVGGIILYRRRRIRGWTLRRNPPASRPVRAADPRDNGQPWSCPVGADARGGRAVAGGQFVIRRHRRRRGL